jgi:hypothetical protein
MNSFIPEEPGHAVDPGTLAIDDLLLDQLGRGEQVTDSGDVATMLAHWRAVLPDRADGDEHLFVPAPPSPLPTPTAARSHRLRRATRKVLAGATAVILAFGGATLAAAHVGPDSALWPITQLVYPEHAGSKIAADAAARTIGAARTAVDQGHFTEAVRMLDDASVLIARVRESDVAERMRVEITRLRGLIPGVDVGPVVSEVPGSVPPRDERSVPGEPPASAPPKRPAEPPESAWPAEAPSTAAPAPLSGRATPDGNVSLPPPMISTPAAPLPTAAIRPDALEPGVTAEPLAS